MRDGYRLQLGHRIPRSRIEASYLRDIGPSPTTFGPRRIQRRNYSVPGPMALVHCDGQHGLAHFNITLRHTNSLIGLIRWKLVRRDVHTLVSCHYICKLQ